MASCEKCWEESRGNYILYKRLLATQKCTPEEQAGKYSYVCAVCCRVAVHQYCGVCMNCGRKDTAILKAEVGLR